MRRIIENVLKVLAIILVVSWISMVFIDYFKAKDEKDPLFCIKKETKIYSDGEVFACTGLGYKMYRYEREKIRAIEFGPFYIKERTSAKD